MKKNSGKILLNTAAVLVGLFLLAPGAGAQTTALKKAVEEIKDSVDLLIGAKDSDSESLAFRVETFKKVVELAITEAKDLKIKILGFETEDETVTAWKESRIAEINALVSYYAEQEESAVSLKEPSLENLKKIAQDFKDHRENVFRPLAEEIGNFFLIQQENKALETAQKRLAKIAKDIEKLKNQKIKNIAQVDAFLEKSGKLINEGLVLNNEATDIFWEKINASSSTFAEKNFSAALETDQATSSEELSPPAADIGEGGLIAPEIQEPSIKDLVYASLNSVKGAYQTFIDLSNLVRELLK